MGFLSLFLQVCHPPNEWSSAKRVVFWADMAEDYSFKKGNILHTAQAQYKNVLIGPLGPSLYSCRGAGQLFSCGSFIQ